MGLQHLRCALVRQNQKLIVAPAPHLLGWPQPVGQSLLNLFEHCLAGSCTVRLAQLRGLIDGNPKHAQRQAAARKVSKHRRQPVLYHSLARLHVSALATLSVRQRIQVVGGMKEDRHAHAPAHAVAQHEIARHHRHVMALLVRRINQRSVAQLTPGIRLYVHQPCASQ